MTPNEITKIPLKLALSKLYFQTILRALKTILLDIFKDICNYTSKYSKGCLELHFCTYFCFWPCKLHHEIVFFFLIKISHSKVLLNYF